MTQPYIEDAEELYQQAPFGYLTMQADGLIVNINTTLLDWLGYKRNEIIVQKSFQDLLNMGDKIYYETHIMPLLQMHREVSEINIELKGKEPTKLPALINARQVARSGLQPVYRFSVLNISQRKKYEVELMIARKNAEQTVQRLNQMNMELEQFAYVASHDLKEPLRMVTNFMGKLKIKYAGQLDTKANTYLDFALDGGKRMQKMVSDLLELSRSGGKEDLKKIQDLNEILSEVESNLSILIGENQAKIKVITALPVLPVYASQINSLLQNLLTNAIKFCKKEIEPVIYINAIEQQDVWLFSIQDNGIGMEQQETGKVFEIFTRLASSQEYEGSGIGLAVCKKIVEGHGGSIWVQSAKGKGSTFYFTIQK